MFFGNFWFFGRRSSDHGKISGNNTGDEELQRGFLARGAPR